MTTDPTPSAPWARPNDPGGYLAHQLMLVRTGRRHRAPGIRRCTDCREPFIDDHAGLDTCSICRIHHKRHCTDCGQPFRNTADGDRRCLCCRQQLALFDPAHATKEAHR